MQQANPDAGNPRSSDSDGKGVWQARDDRIEAKWVELTGDGASDAEAVAGCADQAAVVGACQYRTPYSV